MLSVNGNKAQIVSNRSSACSSCHSCKNSGSCHAELVFGKQTEDVVVEAFNGVSAKIGDSVVLSSSTGKTLAVSAVLFVLPVILSFVSYVIASKFTLSDNIPVLCMLLVLVVSFAVFGKLMNVYAKNHLKIHIVRIVKESEN